MLLHISVTTCFSCSLRYGTIQLVDGRDSGETRRQFVAGVATVQFVRTNAAVIKHRARQTGLSYTMFLMSRCYGTRPHDKWYSLHQLLENMPYFQIKNRRMGLTERCSQVHEPVSHLATDRCFPF